MAAPEKLNSQLRLVPDMVSLRLLVLAFVKGYIGRWGASPSYGEIAEATGTNRTRVKKAVRSLQADGLLLRLNRPGSAQARALALPAQRDAAAQLLTGLGYRVLPIADDLAEDSAAMAGKSITDRPLRAAERLDYDPELGTRLDHAGEQDGTSAQHGQSEATGPENRRGHDRAQG